MSSVTKGEEFLGRFKSSDISERGYCTKCGGHIIVEHPTLGLMDVRIGALRNFPFKPKVHLNYAETILPMRDGLLETQRLSARRSEGQAKHFPSSSSSHALAVSAQLVNANRRVSAADRKRNRRFNAVQFTGCFLHRF